MQRKGMYPGSHEGFVPGLEVAGTVADVGEGVSADLIGQQVYAQVAGGGYAEDIVVSADSLVRLPHGVKPRDAVALGINAAVAQGCCDRAAVGSGQRVLVRGAGGGIGVLVVQIAHAAGAHVTAVTSSDDRGAKLRKLGADALRNRSMEGESTGDSYDVIIDPVGGAEIGTSINALAPNGRYVLCGIAGGLPSPDFGMSLALNFQRSLSFSTFSLSSLAPAELKAMYAALLEKSATGSLQPVIADELQLEGAAEAHRRIEAGQVFGKIVLTA